MTESQRYLPTAKDDLLDAMRLHKEQGWRLCQISATAKDGYDLMYSLERDHDMTHVRVQLARGQWVDSVSGVFAYAYLYENELKDLFGIDVRGISVDFHGQLYQTSAKAPFDEGAPEKEDRSHG